MRPKQKIITTLLWSCLVLTMVAVVGLGMWPEGAELPVLFDAPQFALTDQDGQPFASDQLKGKVWVAALIFTKCPGRCPMMTQQMARLQNAVPAKNVMLVSFSVDPERDTPAVLKEYAKQGGADESRWRFLTGEKQAIFDAARGLNLTALPAEGERPIQHAETFLLIDAQGKVRGIYDSKDDTKLDQLTRDAETLAEERA